MYKLGLLANGIMSGRRKRITKEARAKYWGKAWSLLETVKFRVPAALNAEEEG